jgi:hypothetical protein
MTVEDPCREFGIRQYTICFSGRVFFECAHRKAMQEVGISFVSAAEVDDVEERSLMNSPEPSSLSGGGGKKTT